MVPFVFSSKPEIILSRVDFPHPEEPTIAINCSLFTSKDILFIALISPFKVLKVLEILLISNNFCILSPTIFYALFVF